MSWQLVRARLTQRRQSRPSADREAGWRRAGAGRCQPGLPGGPSFSKKGTGLSEGWSWKALCRSQGVPGRHLIVSPSGILRYREGCWLPRSHDPTLAGQVRCLSQFLIRPSLSCADPWEVPSLPGPRLAQKRRGFPGPLLWAESPIILHFQCPLSRIGGHLPLITLTTGPSSEGDPGLPVTPATLDQ